MKLDSKGQEMKGPAHKMLIVAVGIIFSIMLIAGCEEEETNASTSTSDAKRSRLIAIENAQLKKQIEEMKRANAREINRQKTLLGKCEKEKADLEKMSSTGVESYMKDMLEPLAEENSKLQEEIKALKAQLENR
jgi:hypothetical protein